MQKRLTILFAFAILTGSLASCGGESAKTESTITDEQAVEMAAETIAIEESLQNAAEIEKKIEAELKLMEEEAAQAAANTK